MQRIKIFVVAVGLVLIVCLGGFFVAGYFFTSALAVPSVSIPAQLATSPTEDVIGFSAVSNLRNALTGDSECVLYQSDVDVEGTAFISHSNVRVDLLNSNNQIISYVATTTGDQLVSDTLYEIENVRDLVVSYRCWSWIPDRSVFDLRIR